MEVIDANKNRTVGFLVKAFFCCGFWFWSVNPVLADQYEGRAPLVFLVGMGLNCCGDTIDTVDVVYDGNHVDSNDIDAGALLHIYAGLVYRVPQSPYGARMTLGWFFDSVDADNGGVSFDRYPFEFIPYIQQGPHRFGVGATYHMNPEYDISDFASENLEFDNALGIVFEYGFQWVNRISLDFRYVDIEYEASNADRFIGFKDKYDGSHFGVYISATFE